MREAKFSELGRRPSSIISDILQLIKLRQTLLLLAAMYAGYVAGGGLSKPLAVALAAGVLGFTAIAATTALNMVYDVDIDAIMTRTRLRPLPRRVFNPQKVKQISLAILVASMIASLLLLGPLFALFMLLGYVFDIYAYTLLSKRRTWLSIFLGSVAGMAPALGGYALAANTLDARGVALAALIGVWIPAHIWLLAIHYLDDYKRAGVPMLPVVAGYKVALTASMASIVATIFVATILLALGAICPLLYTLGLSASTAALISSLHCKPMSCKTPFKLVNISLALYLLGVVLGKLIDIQPLC